MGNKKLPAAVSGPIKSLKKESPKSAFEKRIASGARWLHIYLSMISFAVLFFFAITGLTLNHPAWFEGQEKVSRYNGKLQVSWVNNSDTTKIAKLEVVEYLRLAHGIKGYISDFRIDDHECAVSFRGPGYFSDAYIKRETGEYELSETRLGLMAVMNDLHKGRDTGSAWAKVVDISAVLMTLVSLTGFIMIFFLKRRKISGLLLAIAGLTVVMIVYLFFVL